MRQYRCVLCAALVMAACSTNQNWSYQGSTGPDHWAALDADYVLAKEGKSQSPIDLATAVSGGVGDVAFDYRATTLQIHNDGLTMRVDYNDGSSMVLDGDRYDLTEIVFHSPSEHTHGGKTFPMEIQLFHVNADDDYAIVSVFVTEGAAHDTLQRIWDYLPSLKGSEAEYEAVTYNAIDLLPEDRTYFRYSGSLTTPPCSENVQWIIMKTPVEALRTQIKRFRAFYHGNTRPIQPLHARTVRVGGSG